MLNKNRRGLLLGLALSLGACAGAAPEPANQATRGDAPGTDAACRSYSLGNSPDITPPRFLSGEQPAPPAGGAQSGYACVRVTITPSGSVVEPVVVKTDNQEFARAFVRALADWKYEPATRGSARVSYKTVLVARFPPG
jgi:TonB family protein